MAHDGEKPILQPQFWNGYGHPKVNVRSFAEKSVAQSGLTSTSSNSPARVAGRLVSTHPCTLYDPTFLSGFGRSFGQRHGPSTTSRRNGATGK